MYTHTSYHTLKLILSNTHTHTHTLSFSLSLSLSLPLSPSITSWSQQTKNILVKRHLKSLYIHTHALHTSSCNRITHRMTSICTYSAPKRHGHKHMLLKRTWKRSYYWLKYHLKRWIFRLPFKGKGEKGCDRLWKGENFRLVQHRRHNHHAWPR